MTTRVLRFSHAPFPFLTPLLSYSSGFCFVSPGLEHGSPLTSVCASSHSPFLPDESSENANLILPCPNWKLIQCLCWQKDSLLDPNLLFEFIPQSTQVNSLLQSQPTWVVQFHLCVFSSREILQFWVALSFPLHIFIYFLNIFIYECIHLFGWTRFFSCGMWDLVPDHRLNPGPQHWECKVLATGPPGKSLLSIYFNPFLPLWLSTSPLSPHFHLLLLKSHLLPSLNSAILIVQYPGSGCIDNGISTAIERLQTTFLFIIEFEDFSTNLGDYSYFKV